jgi:hypothetical protein
MLSALAMPISAVRGDDDRLGPSRVAGPASTMAINLEIKAAISHDDSAHQQASPETRAGLATDANIRAAGDHLASGC